MQFSFCQADFTLKFLKTMKHPQLNKTACFYSKFCLNTSSFIYVRFL